MQTHTHFTCNYCQFVGAERSQLMWPLCASMMAGFFNNVASLSLCAYVRGCVYVCVLGGVCLNLYFKMRGIIHLKHQGLLMEHRQEYTDTVAQSSTNKSVVTTFTNPAV